MYRHTPIGSVHLLVKSCQCILFFHPFPATLYPVVKLCAMNFKRVNPAAKFGPASLHFVTNVTATWFGCAAALIKHPNPLSSIRLQARKYFL